MVYLSLSLGWKDLSSFGWMVEGRNNPHNRLSVVKEEGIILILVLKEEEGQSAVQRISLSASITHFSPHSSPSRYLLYPPYVPLLIWYLLLMWYHSF